MFYVLGNAGKRKFGFQADLNLARECLWHDLEALNVLVRVTRWAKTSAYRDRNAAQSAACVVVLCGILISSIVFIRSKACLRAAFGADMDNITTSLWDNPDR